ncbi:MAG: hypothetical protein AAF360_03810 [Pseudomonadota bacterium]
MRSFRVLFVYLFGISVLLTVAAPGRAADPVELRLPEWAGLATTHHGALEGPFVDMARRIAKRAGVDVVLELVPPRRLPPRKPQPNLAVIYPQLVGAPAPRVRGRAVPIGPPMRVVCVRRFNSICPDAGAFGDMFVVAPIGLSVALQAALGGLTPSSTINSDVILDFLTLGRADAAIMLEHDFAHHMLDHGYVRSAFGPFREVGSVRAILLTSEDLGRRGAALAAAAVELDAKGALAAVAQRYLRRRPESADGRARD